MRLKKQLELIDPRVWRDKNIKFETKLIYKILCAEQSQRCEFTSISIGKGRNIYERIFLQLCKRKRWAVLVTFLKIKWIRSKEYKDDYKYLKVIKLG